MVWECSKCAVIGREQVEVEGKMALLYPGKSDAEDAVRDLFRFNNVQQRDNRRPELANRGTSVEESEDDGSSSKNIDSSTTE